MTATSAEAPRRSPSLVERWPTALAVVLAAASLVVIIGDEFTDLAAGIAAMACIYMTAYVVGRKFAAWPAFPAVIALMVGLEIAGVDSVISMTVLLFVLWIAAIICGRAGDRRLFAVQTAGMIFFGGLTLLALPMGEQGVGVVAGIGFFCHGLWDAYHFVKNQVVNRTWSETCVVVDLILGPALVVVALTS
jgi:hypothetical protein